MAAGPGKRPQARARQQEVRAQRRAARAQRRDARRLAREAQRLARQQKRAARLASVPPPSAPAGGGAPLPAPVAGDKIERAVVFINARARAIASEIIAIGQYLLREFFDNDPRQVASRNRDKMNSFRDLSARKDLLLSHMTLWRAVHLAIQERQLASVTPALQLSPTHKAELLVVHDLTGKRRLATAAAEQGWSKQRLREAIRTQRGRWKRAPSRAGLTAVLRALRVAAKQVRRLMNHPEPLIAVPPAEQQQLLVLLEKTIAALQASLAAARRRRVAGRRPTRRRGAAARR